MTDKIFNKDLYFYMTPERWLTNLINSLSTKDGELIPTNKYWYKDNICFFEYETDTEYLWVSYKYVWQELENEFNKESFIVEVLLTHFMREYLKCSKKLTVDWLENYENETMEMQFNA